MPDPDAVKVAQYRSRSSTAYTLPSSPLEANVDRAHFVRRDRAPGLADG
jgi:hypothetical protein